MKNKETMTLEDAANFLERAAMEFANYNKYALPHDFWTAFPSFCRFAKIDMDSTAADVLRCLCRRFYEVNMGLMEGDGFAYVDDEARKARDLKFKGGES